MENKNNMYETLFVVDVKDGEEIAKETVAKFTEVIAANATVDSVDEWGKRRFAYPIDYKWEGYYALVNFTAAPEFPAELRRLFGIDEKIMRFIVTRREA